MSGYKTLKQRLANEHSRAREAIFFHKICYDLKVAGVSVGSHLQVYKTEVDDVGVDLTVEWGHGLRKFQLKTVGHDSSTARWAVHPGLLKVTAEQASERHIGQWQYHHPFGLNGGVILIEVDWHADTPLVRYSCTDVFLLMLLRDGFLTGRKCSEAGQALRSVMKSEYGRARIVLTRRCFVRAASVIALLELMSMPSRSTMSWKQQFYRIYCGNERATAGPPPEAAARILRERFAALTVMPAQHAWLR